MNGDPAGTEYADESRSMLEGHLSFARFMGISLPEAGEMLLNNPRKAAAAIHTRHEQKKHQEWRAEGFVPCERCGGAVRPGLVCPCGESAPGAMDPVRALAQLRRRYAPGQ